MSSASRLQRETILAGHGACLNQNGGVYVRGESYGYAKKLQVAAEYQLAKAEQFANEGGEGSVNINAIARQCNVGWHFVNKVVKELLLEGRVLRPSEIFARRDVPRGAGSICLDEFDGFIILQLYEEEPSRSLKSYVDWLCEYSGKKVSKSTISRFFLHHFPIRGGMVKPNLVPYDKFRPANEAKAYEYLYMMSHFDPERVKFGDEKSLKGQELYSRLVRRDPRTGEVPDIITDPDFRNTHSITGFCGIDRNTNPVWYRIHKETNNSEQFMADVEGAVATGFLVPGDILVLDNAAYHTGKGNGILADWLWNYHGIFVVFLPARTPEWNPIELVWSNLVRRLNTKPLNDLRKKYKTDCSAHAAKEILDEMTHEEIAKHYQHCYKGL